jgi:hypothetical protein
MVGWEEFGRRWLCPVSRHIVETIVEELRIDLNM